MTCLTREVIEEYGLRNPGAISVIAKMPDIVPHCERHNIRGPLIWTVFSDICDHDTAILLAFLSGSQDDVTQAVRGNDHAHLSFSFHNHPYANMTCEEIYKKMEASV